MPKNETPTPDFEAMAEKLKAKLPKNVAEKAKAFFKGSFRKEGFTDYGFIPWAKRKDDEPHRILTASDTLMNSITIKTANMNKIEIEAGEGVPYAEIQNNGGTINVPVTDKMKRYFWYMYKKTGKARWKWMALTQKENFLIHIPPRQYIGESHILMKNIDKYAVKEITKTFRG